VVGGRLERRRDCFVRLDGAASEMDGALLVVGDP